MTNELLVTNLQPYKVYLFKVFATNEIGSSPASIEASISTEQGLPSAPRNLQVSCLVWWKLPSGKMGLGIDRKLGVDPPEIESENVLPTYSALAELLLASEL